MEQLVKSVKFWLFIALAVFVVIATYNAAEVAKLRIDKSRLESNVKVLLQKPVIRDSGRTIDVNHLEMELSELKESIPGLKSELKEMGVNINRLSSLQKATMEVNAKFTASVTDTIIKNQEYLNQHFSDKFLQYSSLQKKGDTTSKVNVVVPIDITNAGTLWREGWPFGLGWFKPWKLKQTMHTDNPYVKLNYQEVIDVKRN